MSSSIWSTRAFGKGNAAKAATARFDEAGQNAGVSIESRVIDVNLARSKQFLLLGECFLDSNHIKGTPKMQFFPQNASFLPPSI